MGKKNWMGKLACFFLISFLVVSIGCEMPWNNSTGSDTTNVGGNTDGTTGGTGGTTGGTGVGSSIDFIIPTKSIIIDGNNNDWNDIEPVFVDNINDENPNANFNGTDIYKFYLAKDETYIYIMMTLYDGSPLPESLYIFWARQDINADSLGDYFTWTSLKKGHSVVYIRNTPNNSLNKDILVNDYPSSYSGFGSNFIEWKVRLSDMGTLNGKYARFYSHVTGNGPNPANPVSDENITDIRLIIN